MSEHVDAAGVLRRALPWDGAPRPLGRHVVHDPRSRAYRADTSGVTLRRVVHAHHGFVLDQSNLRAQGISGPKDPDGLGSCTGNSGEQNLACAPLYRHGDPLPSERDAIALYEAATRLDDWAGQYPPDDTGSSGLAVGKALQAAGRIARYEWGFGVDDALKLAVTGPLSVGTVWTNDMFDPDEQGFIRPTGADAGGHQWTIRGIDPHEEWVLILNSWGSSWGGWLQAGTTTSYARRLYPGHARLRFADLETLLARQGDVVRFVR